MALDGLTFSLTGEKIYGLLGRNGSGKTSLLSVLAAFRKPTSGTVRIGGSAPFENDAAFIAASASPACSIWRAIAPALGRRVRHAAARPARAIAAQTAANAFQGRSLTATVVLRRAWRQP